MQTYSLHESIIAHFFSLHKTLQSRCTSEETLYKYNGYKYNGND